MRLSDVHYYLLRKYVIVTGRCFNQRFTLDACRQWTAEKRTMRKRFTALFPSRFLFVGGRGRSGHLVFVGGLTH